MSRPFSYNDENFTVIGNMLFCHIKIKQDVPANSNIIEIPPEIVKRLLYYSNSFISVLSTFNSVSASPFSIGIKQSRDNKYFFITTSALFRNTTSYIIGTYFLSDI